MHVVQRQMPPDVADVAAVAQQLAQHRLGLAAVGTFEVAVLDKGDGCALWPADVVATLGVDGHGKVDQRLRRSEQRADAAGVSAAGRWPGNTSHVSTEAHTLRGQDAELRLGSELLRRENAIPAISSETVKPIPAIVPPPASAAQPTGGRRRPRLSLVTEQRAADDPGRLPGDVPDEDAEADRRPDRVGEEAAVDVDARIGKREQRHDHVARPRMEALLGALVQWPQSELDSALR